MQCLIEGLAARAAVGGDRKPGSQPGLPGAGESRELLVPPVRHGKQVAVDTQIAVGEGGCEGWFQDGRWDVVGVRNLPDTDLAIAFAVQPYLGNGPRRRNVEGRARFGEDGWCGGSAVSAQHSDDRRFE